MKISLNWLKKFTDIELSVDELVTKIGAQLGAVEEVVNLGEKYQGIVIAEVISCEKHPNADKLSVCKLDNGGKVQDVERDENGHVQVVCGAPNVRAGLKVAWLPPGATVPSTFDSDPFVLGSRELRGVMSNGMIASAAELAISDDHEGILEIETPEQRAKSNEQSYKPGSDFAEVYELNDYIIDIENKMFTHRPDCFGILGVAREIAGIQGIKFQSPDWYSNPTSNFQLPTSKIELQVENKAGELVPRFMAVAMTDVEVKPSPIQLQTYLTRVGLKPINNIVDITNYIMYLTGQPLHAYDLDKLRQVASSKDQAVRLESRLSRKGDKIKLLGGKELELQDDSTILITSNDVPVGLGGVMGGAETEVDENTKNIVLECANFDMYNIRRTSMKYGLFTDAVTRFNKGQSPLQNGVVTGYAVALLQDLASGQVASDVVDVVSNEQRAMSKDVEATAEFINARLGLELSGGEMATLLRNVEFDVKVNGSALQIKAPFWRTDIEIKEDIVEEIGRLYGFDKLPVELPKRSIQPAQKNHTLELKSTIRDVLSRAGANEVLTYSFVHGKLLDKVGQARGDAFELTNALSPDLQYYRTSLTPSLLDKIHGNIKAGHDEFALFEIGKSHIKRVQDKNEPELPMEVNAVSLVFAADEKSSKKYSGAAFYQANEYLQALADGHAVSLIRQPLTEEMLQENPTLSHAAAPYEISRSAVIKNSDGVILGVIGEFKQSLIKTLKLPKYAAGFELGLRALLNGATNSYKSLSRFPKTTQDISLKVSDKVHYADIKAVLDNGLDELTGSDMTLKLEPLDIYQKNSEKHFTFRLNAAHYNKTLLSAEINELLDSLAAKAQSELSAERI